VKLIQASSDSCNLLVVVVSVSYAEQIIFLSKYEGAGRLAKYEVGWRDQVCKQRLTTRLRPNQSQPSPVIQDSVRVITIEIFNTYVVIWNGNPDVSFSHCYGCKNEMSRKTLQWYNLQVT
jgi:hypothetical protein